MQRCTSVIWVIDLMGLILNGPTFRNNPLQSKEKNSHNRSIAQITDLHPHPQRHWNHTIPFKQKGNIPSTVQNQDKGSYPNASLLKLNQNGSGWNSSPSPFNLNPSRLLPDALHFTQTRIRKQSRTRGFRQT